MANAWETLTFDFANQAAGTAALNLAYTYNKVSIFFNFGVTGAAAGAKTYYFDDVAFGGGTRPRRPPGARSPSTRAAVTYTLTGFGGADDSTVVVDPTDAANKVARVVKSATAELWAGTTVSTGPNISVPTLPFTAGSTKMTVRVWSPDAGIQVRLKAEDAADPTKLGRDRGDDHGGQRLGDADLRLRQPGGGHGRAEPGLHLQQGLDLLQLRRDRRRRRARRPTTSMM
ncbi:MAG: hypothetical protein M0C28_34530 [Candidatus Moduliflexus flocculans]|nr:hypothetical protein [Candidatus Moduliflexus flocculans]